MKRTKVGDLYTVKVPNGYKVFQWAYSIPKKGDFIRVFENLYDSIPDNLFEIVNGPHDYIIAFDIKRAYRIGLVQALGNYPIPNQYPFPDYMLAFHPGGSDKIGAIAVDPTSPQSFRGEWFRVSHINELPHQYQEITLINSYISPAWLLYLFDINFTLEKLESFFPCEVGENPKIKLQKYSNIVDKALLHYQSKNDNRK